MLTYEGRDWHGLLAGLIAGFSSTLAHAGGPPVAIYLLLQKVPPIEFNASTVLFFAILNWVKVPYYAYAGVIRFPPAGANSLAAASHSDRGGT